MQEISVDHKDVPKYKPRKATFRSLVLKMVVGGWLPLPEEYTGRQSRYQNAKKAAPTWSFSVKKQDDGTFRLIRNA